MTLIEVENLANNLMAQHGLIANGWKFAFMRAATTIGRCSYRKKLIEYSIYHLHLPEEEVRDTLLHEIAHYFTPGCKHNYVWKLKAMELGAKPIKCKFAISTKPPKVILVCPNGHEVYRYRKFKSSRRASCVQCCPTFNEKYIFEEKK